MVIKSYIHACSLLSSFNIDIIRHASHDLLGISLNNPSRDYNFLHLELQYGRHEYVDPKTVRKESWQCLLAEKKADTTIPTRDDVRLELVREFKSDTYYLFRIIK